MRPPRLNFPRSEAFGQIASRAWQVMKNIARRRRKPAPILKPYVDGTTLRRKLAKLLFPLGLGLFCLIYGFFFALTAPYLIVPFAFPVAVLGLLAVWALPDRPHAPVKLMEFLFSCVFISLVLWPNYLALSLPGLPWITINRLVSFPMAFLLLICISTSQDFREELGRGLKAIPGVWLMLLLFIAIQFATIPFSKSVPVTVQRTLIQQINWTCIFAISAWVFQKPGRSERYIFLFLALSLPIVLITTLESRQQGLLWAGHIPEFLKINDPTAAIAMTSSIRGATRLYRAKATFTGPLGLGEFLALLTPFAVYIATHPYRLIVRIACAATIPATFACFIMADSRLGIVGFGVSMLLYVLLWGVMKMFRERSSLIAAAVVYAYPALLAVAVFAVLFVHKAHVMVFGGGAEAASNAARQNQIHMAIPQFLANPIGHGSGQAGAAMGYAADDFITVDNYYLTIALQWGVLGLISFLGMFLLTITYGVKAALRPVALRSRELSTLVPLTISLSAFLVIKAVFSQEDGHSLVFALAGAVTGLVSRVARESAQEERAKREEQERIDALPPAPPSAQESRIRVRRPQALTARVGRGRPI